MDVLTGGRDHKVIEVGGLYYYGKDAEYIENQLRKQRRQRSIGAKVAENTVETPEEDN